jgi:TalC/MipB family fructose-6-phosphate aldolase
MKILIDSADMEKIQEICEYFPIAGVTTNPTILLRTEKDPDIILKQIRSFIGNRELHVQAVGDSCQEFLDDAKAIIDVLGKEVFIKVPSTKEGYKAMKILKAQGYHVTATIVYYPDQALLASGIGVDYIAPYFNRIFKEGMDPVGSFLSMKEIISTTSTRILAASFKTLDQVIEAAKLGIDAMTLSPDIFDQMIAHPRIDEALDRFNSDFHELTGTHSSLKDILKS